MTTTQPFQLRWGIISTGNIAEKFVKDLLIDPSTRQVRDVTHKLTAVGSRTVDKAQEFIARLVPSDVKEGVKAYGSYEEVFADPNVDAVYIGTPHSHHHATAALAIQAGKHVLCEKPVTINAAEHRDLIKQAKEKGVFFMEAMWTRFVPSSLELKRVAEEGWEGGEGGLGLPVLVHADLSGDFHIHEQPITHRILDPKLAGGALFDIGPYPLFWAILALYEHPANALSQPTKITGNMVMTPITPVDSSTVFSLTFSSAKLAAQASLSCSITLDSPTPTVTIRYERGTIVIDGPTYCPRKFVVKYKKVDGSVKEETKEFDWVGGGWHFQADEVARCVRDGKLESALWGHDKSLLEMTIFDEVRKQGGYKFPEGVEKVVD